MRTRWFGVSLFLCPWLAGCSSDGGSADDVVQSADGRSAVDTIMALVSVRARCGDPGCVSSYVDYRQVKSVRLSVDGQTWGTYVIESEPLDAGKGWMLYSEPDPAMLVATLGEERDRQTSSLETIPQWVELLDRHLAPGGHVALVESVVIMNADGTEVAIEPRIHVPFDVEQGDASAYLGEVVVDAELTGGGR